MKSKHPVKTFPIKKRINTELFIDEKNGLFKYKSKGGIGSEGSDQEKMDFLDEGN